MYPVSLRRGAGFTLIEALIGMAIVGVTLAFGMPMVSDWVRTTKMQSATEFYAEGFRLARAEAIKHKASSRISLDANTTNGQLDWQIDLCYPTSAAPCDNLQGSWSTATTPSSGDPDGATNGFKSVFRSSESLPASNLLSQRLDPPGANEIYYNSLGWVNTAVPARITRLTMEAAAGAGAVFVPSAIAITLSGMASKCRPDILPGVNDSRRCPQ